MQAVEHMLCIPCMCPAVQMSVAGCGPHAVHGVHVPDHTTSAATYGAHAVGLSDCASI